MIEWIQHTILYEAFYNALIFLVSIVPWQDVGLAVILLTIIIKTILLPINRKSIKSQLRLKELEPEIQRIKEEYKDDKKEQAKKTMDLYKEHKVNPFSGCLPAIIQIIIIIPLYYVFWKELAPNSDALYSFIRFPETINMKFLGIIDLGGKSLFLAVLAGLSQYFHTKIASPISSPSINNNKKTFQNEMMKSLSIQMKYVMPVFVGFIAYQVSAAIALYWATSNIFTIIQELAIRKKLWTKKK